MNTDTQCLKILRYLAQGHTLTTFQAWKKWNITTASQRCGELVRQGWPLQSRMVKHGKSRVAEYSIPRALAARVRREMV